MNQNLETVRWGLRETFKHFVKESSREVSFRNYDLLNQLHHDFNDLNKLLDTPMSVGVTDNATFISYGGSLMRAADRLWELENEEPACKGMKLSLILVEDPAMYDADWRNKA
jgi:hypothetical protein